MTSERQNAEIEGYLASYRELMGFVPPRVAARFESLRSSNPELLLAQEKARALVSNPADLDQLTVQLMLFAILASRLSDAAKLHGWAARRQGASWEQLQQTLDLAYLFGGQSVANRAPSVLAEIRELEERHGLPER
ncbi:carboxymuconolactone decarboxylase family protein [Enemella evansiae]|uniref:carboxymuconolactone decarboxylase family protein n=1 Tax=Enemella evansiae TaxID=2016499 RepID=UPI00105D1804|nr:carboxymuconolactone decarboxylase family protein [Enemella evansiae]TDO89506.1 alkylhydroperoxidase/carboxymuconolactone decarboxylase family protein YurZ [Enemella evansiae]